MSPCACCVGYRTESVPLRHPCGGMAEYVVAQPSVAGDAYRAVPYVAVFGNRMGDAVNPDAGVVGPDERAADGGHGEGADGLQGRSAPRRRGH